MTTADQPLQSSTVGHKHRLPAASWKMRARILLPPIVRYGAAIAAPGAVAVAQLALQLALLHTVEAREFGAFAFLMVVVQFGYGVSNALICTPYTVTSQRSDFAGSHARLFQTANIIYCLGFGVVAAALATAFGGRAWAEAFALYAAAAMLRWFGRTHAFAGFRATRVVLSDFAYATTLAGLAAVLWSSGRLSIASATNTLLAATLVGLALFGPQFLRDQLRLARFRELLAYREVWRDQSRWTLLGVATTEATANAHSYLVTILAGSSAFAPLAAASLLMKPLGLAITSLSQLERPVISRAINAGDSHRVATARRHFRLALALAWIATIGATALILWLRPSIVVPAGYTTQTITLAALLYSAIAASQAVQAPDSILLQAAGQFHPLAMFSLKACFVSILVGAVMLWLAGPILSLTGIMAGQILMTMQINRHAKSWVNGHG